MATTNGNRPDYETIRNRLQAALDPLITLQQGLGEIAEAYSEMEFQIEAALPSNVAVTIEALQHLIRVAEEKISRVKARSEPDRPRTDREGRSWPEGCL